MQMNDQTIKRIKKFLKIDDPAPKTPTKTPPPKDDLYKNNKVPTNQKNYHPKSNHSFIFAEKGKRTGNLDQRLRNIENIRQKNHGNDKGMLKIESHREHRKKQLQILNQLTSYELGGQNQHQSLKHRYSKRQCQKPIKDLYISFKNKSPQKKQRQLNKTVHRQQNREFRTLSPSIFRTKSPTKIKNKTPRIIIVT